jgi:hypothetical protein
MKRLKPLLMFGSPAASTRAPPVPLPSAADAMGDDVADSASADIQKPPPLPDARVVRARALYLVRAAVTDDARASTEADLSAAGGASIASAAAAALITSVALASTSVAPAPQRVLDRLPAVAALMQHMCVAAVASRAEVRGHCAEVIVTLRALLPHSLRRAFCRFLLKFSRTSKVPNRIMAVEIAARLLGASVGAATAGIAVLDDATVEAQQPCDSSLAALMQELRLPSAGDARFELEGYGEDAADYAGRYSFLSGRCNYPDSGFHCFLVLLSLQGPRNKPEAKATRGVRP